MKIFISELCCVLFRLSLIYILQDFNRLFDEIEANGANRYRYRSEISLFHFEFCQLHKEKLKWAKKREEERMPENLSETRWRVKLTPRDEKALKITVEYLSNHRISNLIHSFEKERERDHHRQSFPFELLLFFMISHSTLYNAIEHCLQHIRSHPRLFRSSCLLFHLKCDEQRVEWWTFRCQIYIRLFRLYSIFYHFSLPLFARSTEKVSFSIFLLSLPFKLSLFALQRPKIDWRERVIDEKNISAGSIYLYFVVFLFSTRATP